MQIKIFSTPTCMYCQTLKAFLKEKNIAFEDIDVSRDQIALKEMVDKSGQMGVPVIDIDGQIVVGFDRNKIVELLKIKI
ncbi:MAG: NrdH-redoxin [Candidatus Nealsonbacteria bacterium RIFCSPLOWO2_01_FULL_41_9]|uniref:NrdH-redoxin n=1 Tax=Candidatus Nealsonbacteria bacterium RIFCSPLOWO2_01_FULL_41_9 TaxID=1801671 RepID=A0A1G2EBC1_9BACT|nr:MAG: NrdH-redoxin [Candidatus Nealsonbacteria bacterium RIFCSPLOWO2_01_FULL_41_9]